MPTLRVMTKATTDLWYKHNRLGGLRRFAIAITVLNVLGHFWFGFEQSWAHPLVALAAAYATELLIEFTDSRLNRRPPRYAGGFNALLHFLLAAHISGMAVSMLLYANERLWPVAFAAGVAIASKSLLRVTINGHPRHFLNPSNFGITVTLLLFPWVGIAQPYMFTENLYAIGDWVLPAVIICTGTFLNTRFTKRLPLIAGWLIGFASQALLRSWWFGTPPLAPLVPMTGVAFLLFTFYMVTDPPTTPATAGRQFLFGLAVAATYGFLMTRHIVFGLFFALTTVTSTRGIFIYLLNRVRQSGVALEPGIRPAVEPLPHAAAAALSPEPLTRPAPVMATQGSET